MSDVSAPSVVPIEISLIQYMPGFNNRRELIGIEELSQNIKSKGQMIPAVVIAFDALKEEEKSLCKIKKGKRFGLVSGHRRFAAIEALGWQNIEAKILPSSIDLKEAKVLNLIENVQREDLTTYETAQGCLDLCDKYDMSHSAIASQLGKSKSYIGNLIRCSQKLAPEILQCWRDSDPQATVDYLLILAKYEPEKQLSMWAEKKGLGPETQSGNEHEEEENEEEEPPEVTGRVRRPSPQKVEALSEWIKEVSDDSSVRRLLLSIIRICQGKQHTIQYPISGRGKKPQFDIRNIPRPEPEE